jgi:hypothetical protein
MTIRLNGPEWDPLFAYAESQGMSVQQATRELLLASLGTTAVDAVFLTAAKFARHKMTTIAYRAATNAMKNAWDEMRAQAIAAGIPAEDLY